jgi:hypothetical protein
MRLWNQLSAVSPNRHATAPAARLFHIRQQSEKAVTGLLGHLPTLEVGQTRLLRE